MFLDIKDPKSHLVDPVNLVNLVLTFEPASQFKKQDLQDIQDLQDEEFLSACNL